MPFISTRTNKAIDEKVSAELKSALGKAITAIPGKSESWLMVENTGNCDLYFKGKNDGTIVFSEVKIFGTASNSAYDALTSELTKIYVDILGADADKVYIKYEEVEHWGWNGINF